MEEEIESSVSLWPLEGAKRPVEGEMRSLR